jgi:hypothetical protein
LKGLAFDDLELDEENVLLVEFDLEKSFAFPR